MSYLPRSGWFLNVNITHFVLIIYKQLFINKNYNLIYTLQFSLIGLFII